MSWLACVFLPPVPPRPSLQEVEAEALLYPGTGLLEPALATLSKKAADAVLQSELVDLLGFDNMPLLQACLVHRDAIKANLMEAVMETTERPQVPDAQLEKAMTEPHLGHRHTPPHSAT